MENLAFTGGDTPDESQATSSLDRRYPTKDQITQEVRILKQAERQGLTPHYDLARVSMENFFAAGNPRPEHGDESY